jgi:hypothetical protein
LIKLAGGLHVTPNDLLEGITWEASLHRPGRFLLGSVLLVDEAGMVDSATLARRAGERLRELPDPPQGDGRRLVALLPRWRGLTV